MIRGFLAMKSNIVVVPPLISLQYVGITPNLIGRELYISYTHSTRDFNRIHIRFAYDYNIFHIQIGCDSTANHIQFEYGRVFSKLKIKYR